MALWLAVYEICEVALGCFSTVLCCVLLCWYGAFPLTKEHSAWKDVHPDTN